MKLQTSRNIPKISIGKQGKQRKMFDLVKNEVSLVVGFIQLFSRWLRGKCNKAYIVLLPLLYCLTVLSIRVYFEEKLFSRT
jgi:hypothetical protein